MAADNPVPVLGEKASGAAYALPRSRLPWRSALRLPPGDLLAIPAAWLLLGIAAGAIGRVPFRRLAPILGRPAGAVSLTPTVTAAERGRARFVARAVARAARLAPFRADCLPQALAAAVLCRWLRVPTATHLGVKPVGAGDADGPSAHAWSVSGPVAVTGGRGNDRHGVVACFVIRIGEGSAGQIG